MHKAHSFAVDVTWTGNTGEGTSKYTSYERAHHLCFIANSMNFEVRVEPTISVE